MTTTPNPTAEQIVADALDNAYKHEGEVEPYVTAALRAHGLLAEAPTEEQISAAAEALIREAPSNTPDWPSWSWYRFARAALTAAAGVTPQEPTPINGKWICGKCAREVARGEDDGQIPKHHRTCPKRIAPSPDREKLAEEFAEYEGVKRLLDSETQRADFWEHRFKGVQHASKLIADALAARPVLDEGKLAEVIRKVLSGGAYAMRSDELPYESQAQWVARAVIEAIRDGEL